jgi:5,10-methylenetetrahydromethanopterin reductase
MKISCMFASRPDTPSHIALAEELGYHRAWCYDSPGLCSDVWMTLAQAAARTERIGLATGMLIPSLRHIMVNASAIATLDRLAPGRVTIGVSSGLTAVRVLGLKPVPWRVIADYVTTLRRLLHGEQVEWEGAVLQMAYPRAYRLAHPIDVPFVFAAEGPVGLAAAHEAGAVGITKAGPVAGGFDIRMRVLFAHVQQDGEPAMSARVQGAVGPGAALAYHMTYQFAGEAVNQLPGGAEWRAALEAVPAARRHLAWWDGHLVEMNALDTAHIPDAALPALTFVGDARGFREHLAQWEAEGVTEAGYVPAGDIEDELQRVARAVDLDPATQTCRSERLLDGSHR